MECTKQSVVYVQNVATLLSTCIYPALYTVPTVGLLYLTSSAATAWLTFRVGPLLLKAFHGRHGNVSKPSSSQSSAFNSGLGSAQSRQDAVVGAASVVPPPGATMAKVSTSASSTGLGHNAASAIVTTSVSSLSEVQHCTDVEQLLDCSVLHHAKKHTRTAPADLSCGTPALLICFVLLCLYICTDM